MLLLQSCPSSTDLYRFKQGNNGLALFCLLRQSLGIKLLLCRWIILMAADCCQKSLSQQFRPHASCCTADITCKPALSQAALHLKDHTPILHI